MVKCEDCGKDTTHLWYDQESPVCVCGWVGPPAVVKMEDYSD